jgi:hypothetical protein
MKKILTIIIITIYSSYCQAQKERIELNLVKGETYRQHIIADMDMVQSLGGQDMNIKMGVSGKMAYKVLAVLDSAYEIEVKYESLGMKMDMPNGAMSIDSEKENSDDVFSKVLAAMKKNPFNITIK